jgi:hypothetical protein
MSCQPQIENLQQSIEDTYNGPTVTFSLQSSGNTYCCPNVVAGVGYTNGPANYINVNGEQVDLGYVAYVEDSCSYSPAGCYKGINAPCNVSLSGNITFTEDGQYTITYFAGYIENGQLVITDKQDETYQVLGVGTTTPPPSKYKYNVKIEASSTNIVQGQSVTITGAITPATFNLSNPNLQGSLNIYNLQSGMSTNINFNVNIDGTFSVNIPSNDLLLGTNIVSATITGNDPNGNPFSVTSNSITISVSSPPPTPPPTTTTTTQSFTSNLLQFVKNNALIISIGTASIITAAALYEIYKRRK